MRGFGSSSTAVVLTEFLMDERKIRILYSEEFELANPHIVDCALTCIESTGIPGSGLMEQTVLLSI